MRCGHCGQAIDDQDPNAPYCSPGHRYRGERLGLTAEVVQARRKPGGMTEAEQEAAFTGLMERAALLPPDDADPSAGLPPEEFRVGDWRRLVVDMAEAFVDDEGGNA